MIPLWHVVYGGMLVGCLLGVIIGRGRERAWCAAGAICSMALIAVNLWLERT